MKKNRRARLIEVILDAARSTPAGKSRPRGSARGSGSWLRNGCGPRAALPRVSLVYQSLAPHRHPGSVQALDVARRVGARTQPSSKIGVARFCATYFAFGGAALGARDAAGAARRRRRDKVQWLLRPRRRRRRAGSCGRPDALSRRVPRARNVRRRSRRAERSRRERPPFASSLEAKDAAERFWNRPAADGLCAASTSMAAHAARACRRSRETEPRACRRAMLPWCLNSLTERAGPRRRRPAFWRQPRRASPSGTHAPGILMHGPPPFGARPVGGGL